jgi:murein tripeptide amidase MpaA
MLIIEVTMMLFSTITLTIGATLSTGQYDGISIVHTHIENQKQLNTLRDLGARSLDCFDHKGLTPMLFDDSIIEFAKKMNIEFEVLETNIDSYILKYEQSREEARMRGLGGWYSDFKTWNEVNTRLNQVEQMYPNIASVFTVGVTHEGRNIQGIRITAPGDSTGRKQVLWNGCQHAREWVAVMVPMYIIDALVDGWNVDSEITTILESTEIIIVPIVNPDGYEFTYAPNGDRFWRKNRRNNSGSCEGVDLNRNWGFAWNGGDSTSTNTCSDVYVGPNAFSEPEAQAMRDLVVSLPNLVAHIDFHSYSQLVLEPWASSNNTPPRVDIVKALSGDISDAILGVHGEMYVAGTGGDLLYLADGVFPDWVTDRGALSYTVELRPTGSPGFDLPPDEILPTCEENLAGAMAMLRFIQNSVSFSFPNGIPGFGLAGEMQTLPITIEPVFEEVLLENTATLHVRYGSNGPFAPRPIQHDSGTQYTAQIPISTCGVNSEYWISIESTDGETHRYPLGEEVMQVGVATEIQNWNMDTNPNWQTSGLWSWGAPTGGGGQYGNPDPTSGATGQYVFGYNLQGDYENNLAEKHLVTPTINVSNQQNIQLQFDRYLNVEQPAYDHASISVRADGGSWSTLWTNTSVIEDSQWVSVSYDLSQTIGSAQTVEIRWTMGTTDTSWRYSGWNIDDVQLLAMSNTAVQGDVNCDGVVDVSDLLNIISNWGFCDGICGSDIVPDGTINVSDLLQVIGNW